jgi:hypothetical protein
MKRFSEKVIFFLVFVVISGCTSQSNKLTLPTDMNELVQDKSKLPVIVAAIRGVSCPILKSDKWHAWLDRFTEKDGQYRLNVNGEVTMPHPGFAMQWSVGPTDRMRPANLRLNLLPKALDVMVIQVLTTEPVKYYLETPISEFSSVSVFCGEKRLSRIEGVTLTD